MALRGRLQFPTPSKHDRHAAKRVFTPGLAALPISISGLASATPFHSLSPQTSRKSNISPASCICCATTATTTLTISYLVAGNEVLDRPRRIPVLCRSTRMIVGQSHVSDVSYDMGRCREKVGLGNHWSDTRAKLTSLRPLGGG